jgi:hypothetical protein
MSKTLAELLADAAADEALEFTAADGTKIKLGDIKGFRGAVETERQAAARERAEATRIATEAKTLWEGLKSAQEEFAKRTAPEPKKGSRWQDNPLYDELVPVLEAAQKAADEAREVAKATKQQLDQASAMYALERMRGQWEKSTSKPAGKKFEEVVQEVIAAKELDEMGLPTLDRYLHRSAEPDRIKTAVAEALATAKKEWDKAQHAANVPKPGKFQVRKSGEPPIKKIEDLNSEVVSQDPEITALWEGQVQ